MHRGPYPDWSVCVSSSEIKVAQMFTVMEEVYDVGVQTLESAATIESVNNES